MAFDWDAIDLEIEEAADETDAQLASQISSLTRMMDEEIQRLFPNTTDKKKLVKLIQIVNQSTDENQRTARLIDNIQELAGTAIKLLAKV